MRWTICFALALAAALWCVVVFQPGATDIHVEKYMAVAAWDGGDPYTTQEAQAEAYGYADFGWSAPSPRPPAAVLIQTALIPIPDGALKWVGAVLAALTFTATAFFASKVAGSSSLLWVAAPALLILADPHEGLWFNLTKLTTPLLLWAWWRLDNPRLAGGLLGVVAAIKLWPLLIIAALLWRRDTRPVAQEAIFAGFVASMVGLTIPGVTIVGTAEATLAAGDFFRWLDPNLSPLYHFGWPVLAVAAVVFWWGLRQSPRVMMGASAVAGLLVLPVIWLDYLLALAPLPWLAGRVVVRGPVEPEEIERRREVIVGRGLSR